MNIRKIGLWSSAICLATFVIYTFCFAMIVLNDGMFTWAGLDDFIRYANTHSQIFKYIAMSLMPVFSFAFIFLLECLRESVCESKKFLIRVATHFAIAFSAIVSVNYFVQISAVRMQLGMGETEGISQFVQSNPVSFINALNLLGWTLFFGIACLLASMAMGKCRTERIIKYALLSDGIMMLCSSVAYIFGLNFVLGIFMFAGLGAATMVASIALWRYFKTGQHECREVS